MKWKSTYFSSFSSPWIQIRDPDPQNHWIRIQSGSGWGCGSTTLFFSYTLGTKIFLQKFCCESGFALDPNLMILWIQIRIELKCWIRIRIETIRIHNPGFYFHWSMVFLVSIKFCDTVPLSRIRIWIQIRNLRLWIQIRIRIWKKLFWIHNIVFMPFYDKKTRDVDL
jgi:hypothetical protein